jgi:hypothetical protein
MASKKIRLLVDSNNGEVFEFSEALELIQQVGTDYSDMPNIRKNLFLARQHSERRELFLGICKATAHKLIDDSEFYLGSWFCQIDRIAEAALKEADKFSKKGEVE